MGGRHYRPRGPLPEGFGFLSVPAARSGQNDRVSRASRWAVGVDAGGTWVRVLAIGGHGRRREARRRARGVSELAPLLRHLYRGWQLRPGNVGALVVASRGVWTPAERRSRERQLRGLARRTRAISDVEAAYHGALGEEPGVLVLAGTGSIALGRDARGRRRRAGGLGPLLGDEGSAFWMGREWLRATSRLERTEPARRLVAAPDAAARIASLAPSVLRRAGLGQREARRIVAAAQSALAELLATVAHDLGLRPPIAVSWAGSLLEDPRFRAGVWRAARRCGLRLAPRAPGQAAVEAAARLARLICESARRSRSGSLLRTERKTPRIPRPRRGRGSG
jgi:glucosamine kinase